MHLKKGQSAFWRKGYVIVQVLNDETCANDKYDPWHNNCQQRQQRQENKHGNKEALYCCPVQYIHEGRRQGGPVPQLLLESYVLRSGIRMWICESLDTAALTVAAQSNSYRCKAGTENIYSVNKCCGFVKCNITHASSVKYGVSALKIHRYIIKCITQNNFWIYGKVSWVCFSAKHWYFSYRCRILFSFSFCFIILCYIEQKIYLFLWRSAISRFKCPKNSGQQGITGL